MDRSLFRFIWLTALLAALPLAAMFAVYRFFDPQDIFSRVPRPDIRQVTGHKGWVSVRQLDRLYPDMEFDSYIIGSSLTVSTPLDEWADRLGGGARGFHFDCSQITICQLEQYIDYVMAKGDVKHIYSICNNYLWYDQYHGRKVPVFRLDAPRVNGNPAAVAEFYRRLFLSFMNIDVLLSNLSERVVPGGDYQGNKRPLSGDNIMYYDPLRNEETNTPADAIMDMLAGHSQRPIGDTTRYYAPHILPSERAALRRIAAKTRGIDFRLAMVSANGHTRLHPADSAAFAEALGASFLLLQDETAPWQHDPYDFYDYTAPVHFRRNKARELLDMVYGPADTTHLRP